MDAKQLRIGSLVLYEGMISVVKEITCTDIVLDHPAYESEVQDFIWDIKPITLAEKELLMFGFEKDEYDPYYDLLNFEVRFYEGAYVYNPISEYFPAYGVGLEYVHDLQNLYFALTGEELKIK